VFAEVDSIGSRLRNEAGWIDTGLQASRYMHQKVGFQNLIVVGFAGARITASHIMR
jgi:hypothetical protein